MQPLQLYSYYTNINTQNQLANLLSDTTNILYSILIQSIPMLREWGVSLLLGRSG